MHGPAPVLRMRGPMIEGLIPDSGSDPDLVIHGTESPQGHELTQALHVLAR